MRILGVDYGDKRTGIALSDPSETLASGLGQFTATGLKESAREIARYAQENGAGLIVLGLPINMNGTEGPRAEKTRALVGLIGKFIDTPIVLFDERQTTVLANTYLNSTQIKKGRRKGLIDTVSAQIILQNYLDRRKTQGANTSGGADDE